MSPPSRSTISAIRHRGRSRLVSRDGLRGRLDRRAAFRRGVLQEQRRVMPEDPLLERSERRGGHQPELLVEDPSQVLQRRERVRVPAAAIQREHELGPRALAQRLASDERLELRRHRGVTPERQIRVDAVLDAVQAELGETGRLEHGERLAELRERLASPEGQRVAEVAAGGARVTRGERRAAGVAQPLEPCEVQRLRLAGERVAARARDEHARGQHLAQLGDVDLHHLRRRLRWVLAPEIGDEALGRDSAVGVQGQPGEQRSGLAASKLHRCGSIAHFERAEEERHKGDGGRC